MSFLSPYFLVSSAASGRNVMEDVSRRSRCMRKIQHRAHITRNPPHSSHYSRNRAPVTYPVTESCDSRSSLEVS